MENIRFGNQENVIRYKSEQIECNIKCKIECMIDLNIFITDFES